MLLDRRALASLLPCPLLLVCACAGAAGPDSPEQDDGYVLLSREARAELSLEIDGWKGAPILPMVVAPGDDITLNGPGQRTSSIRTTPGMLAYVRGADGAVEWIEVGREARADRLLLHGSDASASELALLLGGSAAARGDGLWNLTAPDVFSKTSFMQAPEGLLEAIPDTVIAAEAGDIDIDAINGATNTAIMGPNRADLEAEAGDDAPGRREAMFVGVYTSARSTLLLDASGRYSLEDRCTGETTREGHYYVSDGRVLLQSRGVPALALAIDGESLIPPSGDRMRTFEPAWALAAPGGKP